jgi:hypothetical protein
MRQTFEKVAPGIYQRTYVKATAPKPNPLALRRLSRYFPPAVAKVYTVAFAP